MGCKSMFSSCSTCCFKSGSLLTICIRDNYNVLSEAGLFQNIKICDQFSCCRIVICENCISKSGIFDKLSLGCLEKTPYHLEAYHRMQDRPSPVEEELPEIHSPNQNCTCETCQKKFGGLNLLADVVENIQKSPEILKRKLESIKPESDTKRFKSDTTVPENLEKEVIHVPALSYEESSIKSEEISINTEERSSSLTTQTQLSVEDIQSSREKSVIQRIYASDISQNISQVQKSLPELGEPSTSSGIRRSPKSIKIMNCEHCGKSFTHRGDLNKHLRSHTGEQPFVCPVCQRRFTHTSNLARHVRVHSGDKPFRCERCNREFGRKDKLQMHQKTKLCMKHSQQNQ